MKGFNTMPTNERNIETISFGRACRDRIGMYLSGEPKEALHLGLREIYVNSLDAMTEAGQKSGQVRIIIDENLRSIMVKDNGPGIPWEIRKDGKSSLEAAYTLPHSGSHFNGRAVNAIGTNGIGAKVVCHTSTQFTVRNNDGKSFHGLRFEADENGAHLKGEITPTEDDMKMPRGVEVIYFPDEKVYSDVWFDYDIIINELKEMMKFYPNYEVWIQYPNQNYGRNTTVIQYPNGLKEDNTKMYYESDNLIISLGIADENSDPIKAYGNRLYLPQGGKFFTQFKTAMTRNVNNLSGLKLSGQQIQSQFTGYVCIFVDNPLFSNQAKTSIANTEVNTEISNTVAQLLNDFSKTKEWERMVKILEGELKAEEAAERARKKIKDALDGIKKGSKKKIVVAEKLKDCINSGQETYLAISEGDSACGALIQGRDQENVALFPIRGKFINTLKNNQEDYLSNEELQQICSILGCGIFEDYDSKKLRYGKVLIAVDADSDGLNIADLLITFFYVCMPNFIKEGRLYWMRAPLYVNSQTHSYIFTEEEWKKVKNKKGYTRCKGLGEMLPIQVEESLFGRYKRWEQLKPKDWNKFKLLIEKLMGRDVEERRDYIFKNIDFENITFM